MKSHEVLKHVIESVGAKRVAGDLRVSTSLVYKWCEDAGDIGDFEASGARNPLDRIVQLCSSTEDARPVEWLCTQVGGYFVERTEADPEALDAECLRHTQELLAKFSELLGVISESVANEGRIDAEEAARIRTQWRALQGQGEAFVRACEHGVFDPTR